MSASALLLIADSMSNADMLYATGGLFVPDPFICLVREDRMDLVMNDMERGRARKECPRARIHSQGKLEDRLRRQGIESPNMGQVAGELLHDLGVESVEVPPHFPVSLAFSLANHRDGLEISPQVPFPQRARKTDREVEAITNIVKVAEEGIRAGIECIRRAEPDPGGMLRIGEAPLTSEQIRGTINAAVALLDGIPAHTIVAGGNQSFDPHERGHGPLPAHRPIIIDVFPRSATTGYHGDITRTVVRGRASDKVRRMHRCVHEAQNRAIGMMIAGESTARVHRTVQEHLRSQGFDTGVVNGRMQGFYHGTGHGVGLDLHESPGIGLKGDVPLEAGHVVTVEPGLYYPETGGVRLEDVVLVQEGPPRLLTTLEKELEI